MVEEQQPRKHGEGPGLGGNLLAQLKQKQKDQGRRVSRDDNSSFSPDTSEAEQDVQAYSSTTGTSLPSLKEENGAPSIPTNNIVAVSGNAAPGMSGADSGLMAALARRRALSDSKESQTSKPTSRNEEQAAVSPPPLPASKPKPMIQNVVLTHDKDTEEQEEEKNQQSPGHSHVHMDKSKDEERDVNSHDVEESKNDTQTPPLLPPKLDTACANIVATATAATTAAAADWEEYTTAEGEPYFVNKRTKQSTWEKPQVLMSATETQAMSGNYVWVEHEQHAWVPARILEPKNASDMLLVCEATRGVPADSLDSNRTVSAKQLGPTISNPRVLSALSSDLVQLDTVDEPSIIDLLRRRYQQGKIYTSVGSILISVNPFQSTNLFTPSIMHSYSGADKVLSEQAPHPYAIINAAYHDMLEYRKDQSLLISGESGAGKTVTVKVCLEFLSEVAGSDSLPSSVSVSGNEEEDAMVMEDASEHKSVEHKILAANPILEAFGNAKTLRNDNSSRFGKFVEIHFDVGDNNETTITETPLISIQSPGSIVGCTTVTYLLEKSRVISRFPGERNFHILHYLMLPDFPAELRSSLLLDNRSPQYFKYLSPDGTPCAGSDQHDDQEEFNKLNTAMQEMGMVEESEILDVFKAAAAVLHLGNVSFTASGDTGSIVDADDTSSNAALSAFATLTGVNETALSKALTMHVSEQRDGMLTRPFDADKAGNARHALARHLYGRLFAWLVERVNQAMAMSPLSGASAEATESNGSLQGTRKTRFIGMLDIFGFEIFDTNSFEQLCINTANEKLQQLFNRHTFTLEEATYLGEGIAFDHIDFYDSQPLLAFLGLATPGAKTIHDGVFQLLDEQTSIGSGTDAKFLQAIISRHSGRSSSVSSLASPRGAVASPKNQNLKEGKQPKLFSDRCRSRTAFKIFHYAGEVEYQATDLIAKNADKLHSNIETCMAEATNPLIRSFFATEPVALPASNNSNDNNMNNSVMRVITVGSSSPSNSPCPSPSSRSGSRSASGAWRRTKTQASTFMSQLAELEVKTNSTFPRYIRCIKPNAFKQAGVFDAPMSLSQLRFAGVFEAINIRKKGFPFRHTHENFVGTFRPLVPSAISAVELSDARSNGSFSVVAKKLLDAIVVGSVSEASGCMLGKTMVLYRTVEHRALEIARLLVLNHAASVIQKRMRGVYVRMHVADLKNARAMLIKAIQARDTSKLDETIGNASQLFFKVREVYDAECVREAIRQESELRPRIDAALDLVLAECECDTYDEVKVLRDEIVRLRERDPLAFAKLDNADKIIARFTVFESLRSAHTQLQAASRPTHSLPLAPTLINLNKVLSESARLSSMDGSNDGFCLKAAITQAQALLDRLLQEQLLINECTKQATFSEILGIVHHLDVTNLNECVGAFYEALAALETCVPVSVDGIYALKAMDAVYELRVAVLTALAEAEGGHADTPEWRSVETLLKKASGISVETQCEGDAHEEGEEDVEKPFMISIDEIRLVSGEIAFRSAVDDVVAKLHSGIEFVDDELLAVALDQAQALDMHIHPDLKVQEVTAQASVLLPRINHTRTLLHRAYEAVSEPLLREALDAQQSCMYGCSPDRVGYEMVESVQRLLRWVEELTRQARLAVKLLYVEPAKDVVNGCQEIGLDLPELKLLDEFLALPHIAKLGAQQHAAMSVGNYRRAVRLSMEAHGVRLGQANEMSNKALQYFPNLKTPEEFARRFGIGWKRYKASMLHHYNPAFGKLHTTLTRIDCGTDEETKIVSRLGVYLFKNILGVMGDKMTENQDGLAQEVLAKGLEYVPVRDEIYCQIMKQLSKNPKPNSEKRGYNLMAMCLFTFPPSKHLSDYLEVFLLSNNQLGCVLKLHQSLVAGELVAPPSVCEVSKRRAPGVTGLWFERIARKRCVLAPQMWNGDEVVQQQVRDWKQGPPPKDSPLWNEPELVSQSNMLGGGMYGVNEEEEEEPPLWSDVGAPPPPPSPHNLHAPPPPPPRAPLLSHSGMVLRSSQSPIM